MQDINQDNTNDEGTYPVDTENTCTWLEAEAQECKRQAAKWQARVDCLLRRGMVKQAAQPRRQVERFHAQAAVLRARAAAIQRRRARLGGWLSLVEFQDTLRA